VSDEAEARLGCGTPEADEAWTRWYDKSGLTFAIDVPRTDAVDHCKDAFLEGMRTAPRSLKPMPESLPLSNFTPLMPPERKRTYHFPGGQQIALENVTAILVRPSGTHRLETADGRRWIVPPGWLAIELEMDSWTF
jgi:hypothetical protein